MKGLRYYQQVKIVDIEGLSKETKEVLSKMEIETLYDLKSLHITPTCNPDIYQLENDVNIQNVTKKVYGEIRRIIQSFGISSESGKHSYWGAATIMGPAS